LEAVELLSEIVDIHRHLGERSENGMGKTYSTPRWRELLSAREAEWEKTAGLMASKAILNRIGQPIDVASAILFLSSDESSFITGQMLVVDGGRMDYLSHSF
jgi:NAD(P)-dependent dehydrogenase (short-subunit alcohol dehydrogenase family)